jgi:predicted transcriptional regulator
MATDQKLNAKELVRRALDNLPDDVTMPEVIDRLYLLYDIQLGLEDIEAGRVVSHEEAKQRFAKWLA